MGCAQTSENVVSPNRIPVERLYGNEDYTWMETPPAVMITAPHKPMFVKSALKKTHPDGRERTDRLPFINRKPPLIGKSVNFDEQVLVKARTPTPSKIWYEKASSTMPMRKHPPNDDDDDDEEIRSVSSDEEEYNEQTGIEPQIPTLGHPTLLLKRNEPNTLWHKSNTTGLMPPTNTMLENEYFSPTIQQTSFNMNTYTTENLITSSANRIKVRRKLSDLGPPQVALAPSYQSPLQYSTVPLYQSSTQVSTVPVYQIPAQTSFVSPYQSIVQPPTLPSYQSPQTLHIQRSLPNTNTLLYEHRPTLTNSQSSPQTPSYALNRHPTENVT